MKSCDDKCIRIALCQIRCSLGNKKENIAKMKSILEEYSADLYVFPEMFLTGYMIRDEVFTLSESIRDNSFQAVSDLSKQYGVDIVFGAAVNDDIPGIIRNSAVAIHSDGLLEKYDKIHLANFGSFDECLYFTPGENLKIIDVQGFKIGLIICYDIFFPELIKSYALAGVDGVICISASPVTSMTAFETVMPARAVENAIYMVYVNQAGPQLNQVFFGGSGAVDPSGMQMVKNVYFNSDVTVVSLSKLHLARAKKLRPTIRDSLAFPLDIDVVGQE